MYLGHRLKLRALLSVNVALDMRAHNWLTVLAALSAAGPVSAGLSSVPTGRPRRQLPLVFPGTAITKLLIGIAMPVKNPEEISLLFAANFQYQYMQLSNISEISSFYTYQTVSSRKRSMEQITPSTVAEDERFNIYSALEDMLTRRGFNGHSCLLRVICEIAQFPIYEEGLIGEIIHIVLTPDYGQSGQSPDPTEWMEEYLDAQRAGQQMFHCPSLYGNCPEGQGLLELITQFYPESDD